MFYETDKRPAGDFPLSRENDSKTLDEPHRLLLKAADLLEERGWCQGRHEDGRGRLCTLGAIAAADGVSHVDEPSPARREARWLLVEALGTFLVGSQWNDIPGRTKEEVVSTLRRVALGE